MTISHWLERCDDVDSALQSLRSLEETHGLAVNLSKSEWYSYTSPSTKHSGIQVSDPASATIASVPIGSPDFIDEKMESYSNEWDKSFNEILKLDHFQSSLLLLRYCMQLSKVNYFLRTNYTNKDMKWAKHFDASLRKCFEGLMGKALTESQWEQCQLPLKLGGLNLRTIQKYSSAAFIASAAVATSTLTSVYSYCFNTEWIVSSQIDSAVYDYNSQVSPARKLIQWRDVESQSIISTNIASHSLQTLRSSVNDRMGAVLTALSVNQSSAFLHAIPNKFTRTYLENKEMKAIISLRLGVTLSSDHKCHGDDRCMTTMDEFGDHALACPYGKGRIARHDGVVSAISYLLNRARLTHRLECRDGFQGKERPGDIGMKWFGSTRDMTLFDVGVTHSWQPSRGSYVRLKMADSFFNQKQHKYLTKCIEKDMDYIPLIVETFGGWHKTAKDFFRTVAKIIADKESKTFVESLGAVHQVISVALQRGNALAICSHCDF